MISFLAVLLILFILAIAYFGFRYVMNQGNIPLDNVNKEKCSLCRKLFPKNELFVREVDDVKVYFFCQDCIEGLHHELTAK